MTDSPSANERFRALLDEARPPTGGVELAVIAAEVGPVLPLLEELPAVERVRGDFESFEFRECFTVLTLLGRRLALLDLTPTAMLEVVNLALSSVDVLTEHSTERFDQHARMAAVEGFVIGREERVAQAAEARASGPLRPLRVDTHTFALVVTGVHEPTVLTEAVDALGRAMLDADATIAIVDLTQLGEPNRERARAVFAAGEVTRMLGATCIFSGIDPRWRAAAADARIELTDLQVVSTFSRALEAARMAATGARAETNPKWRALLDRLRR